MQSRSETAGAMLRTAAWLDGAVPLSLAAGYAGPLFTLRALLGPAGRRCSLEEAAPSTPRLTPPPRAG